MGEIFQLFWFPIIATIISTGIFLAFAFAVYRIIKNRTRLVNLCPKCGGFMISSGYDASDDTILMRCHCGYEVRKPSADKR